MCCTRLARYPSPPLFPVRLRDLPCHLTLHNVPPERFAPPRSTSSELDGSIVRCATAFATLSGARRFVLFHHDPTHDDAMLDRLDAAVRATGDPTFVLIAGTEGSTFEV